MLLTICLKVSGLLRDIVIAYYFGDTYQADAYLAAFIIPNMIFLFLTTGMKHAFIPSYLEAKETGKSTYLFNQIWKSTGLISFGIGVVGMLIAPMIVPILYPNFQTNAMTIAIHTTVIFMVCVGVVGLNAVFEAYFDAESKYVITTIAQLIVLLTMISSAVLFAKQIGPYALSSGYLFGVILSFLFKLLIVHKQNIIQFSTKIHRDDVKSFFIVFIPVAITVMIGQVNLAVDNIFASYFEEGAVTYINYAKNLVHFPQAIFAVTIGTITFPLIAKSYAKGNIKELRYRTGQGLMVMCYVLLPAITGMMLLMPSIIQLLFERGAFTHEATLATSQVAYYYVGSVIFFSLTVIINNAMYTLKKGYYVMWIGLGSILFNIVCNSVFTKILGYVGIPLASSIVGLVYAISCYLFLSKQIGSLIHAQRLIEITKMILSIIVMTITLQIIGNVKFYIANGNYLLIAIFVGALIYVVCSYILKIEAFYFLWSALRKKENDQLSEG
ncbi:murein biosynthesis integral membrane protein MurJ [Paraliobacillus sp. JSM ZJ581]|uniref:murein biosynthesis integral membrane protein MurJ n=1 Tax=Paraliobacillus sp. JSM ZJ581 TaxID=3342118 RepID=UPI0035A8FACD